MATPRASGASPGRFSRVAYKVTPAFTVELAYRYVSLGDALSGDIITFNGVNNVTTDGIPQPDVA